MKFTLAQSHIDHFNKTGSIEFEEVFTENECEELLKKAEDVLIKRVSPSRDNPLDLFSNENLYLQGRNIWRDGVETKKLCLKKQVGDFAFQLFRKKPIKIAYDQYIRTGTLQDCPFKENATLQEISSIRPLLGALIILLTPNTLSVENPLLPKKAGNALYVAGNVVLPLSSLFNEKNTSVLVIAFTAASAIYCLEPKDPHTHSLKKDGLVFGDTIGEELCPTLYNR